ncbi:MAG: N-acetylmuramic acid 6-phosphate etherase [Bacteroidales bacterium]|nr:N-acetylmuramic acid 6-phosphate etherase [Bacteroidales bacterium]
MKVTEQPSHFDGLETMSTRDLLEGINAEDRTIADVVRSVIPQVELLVDGIVERMRQGGRVFYAGSGTSGRLGVLDSSEIPPTFGAEPGLFIGVISGGDGALRSSIEGAEDDPSGAWRDLAPYSPQAMDTLIGIAASGSTPYAVGAIKEARRHGLLTACITCNPGAVVAEEAEIPIVAVVGPEFVTGSTRMKAGTATKMILNMVSTSVMIRLGHVRGNKMIDMKLANNKLMDRGTRMLMEEAGITDYEKAKELLLKYGSVRSAADSLK